MKQLMLSLLLVLSLIVSSQAAAQTAGGRPSAGAGSILNALPPDLYNKLEQLAQLLDQQIKSGKLTDAQIQHELMSGRLEQTIRSLGPEANQLFDEIQSDMKNGKGPGEEALMPLLGRLSGK
ncbi:MAG TPA: hypothetical protein VJ746_17320 [Nitrospira sp.]|nr:hypothetical protein [Nitrospira sp.]